MPHLNKAWFGELNMHSTHYESHRYRDLNLNNIWRTGTIKVRAAVVISRWAPEVLPYLSRLRVVPSVAVWDFSDGISFQALEQVIQQIAETRASGS